MPTRRRFLSGLGAAALMAPQNAAQAQCAPQMLSIRNIMQETQVWCWAAVSQQIILWLTGNSPPQCALVAIANGAHPGFCCGGYNPACVRTGHLHQIAGLIQHFGGRPAQIAPPAHPQALYDTLANGRAIIMAVSSGLGGGHVVVLRGISCAGPTAVLHINDPMSWAQFSSPTPFSFVARHWQAAIVVG